MKCITKSIQAADLEANARSGYPDVDLRWSALDAPGKFSRKDGRPS